MVPQFTHLWQLPFGIMMEPHSGQVGASVRAMKLKFPFRFVASITSTFEGVEADTDGIGVELAVATTCETRRRSPLASNSDSDSARSSLTNLAPSQRKM